MFVQLGQMHNSDKMPIVLPSSQPCSKSHVCALNGKYSF